VASVQLPSSPKILIADDEKTIAQMWGIIFSHLGFEVAVCFDGREAIRMARLWHPDLFVTDMQMPRMDGVEAALRIHKLLPGCGIVILSASSDGSDELKLIRKCHLEYIPKPVTPSVLIDRVQALLPTAALPPKIGVRRVTVEDHAHRHTR